VKPTLIAKHAGNWVDRGEAATPRMMALLAFFFRLDAERDPQWLEEHARIIEGMVAADATTYHVGTYLRHLWDQRGLDRHELPSLRLASAALWSTAKATQVRDFAERVLRGEVPANTPTPDTFSHWIAARLLDAEELEEREEEVRPGAQGSVLDPKDEG
jgi:hypothetical protein